MGYRGGAGPTVVADSPWFRTDVHPGIGQVAIVTLFIIDNLLMVDVVLVVTNQPPVLMWEGPD